MILRTLAIASLPLLFTGCNSDGSSAVSPHASISISGPGGGALAGSNPDRRPAGSASASISTPQQGVTAGTARSVEPPDASTTQPSNTNTTVPENAK